MDGIRQLLRRVWSAPKPPNPTPYLTRSFAAVALQYDSDYITDGEEDTNLSWKDRFLGLPKPDACEMIKGRGVQWVLIGSPGLQKHIYAARLAKLLHIPHISMGSLVRQELSPRSPIYKQIAKMVNEGTLIPEDVIFELLANKLDEGYYKGESGFILDGIPRTKDQAVILDQMTSIDLVVNFKCKEDCILKRKLRNVICSNCGQPSNVNASGITSLHLYSYQQPSECPAECLKQPHNDKLRIYNQQRKHMEDYYRRQQKLLDFTVSGGIQETWQGLLAALHLQHVDLPDFHSSQKLTL